MAEHAQAAPPTDRQRLRDIAVGLAMAVVTVTIWAGWLVAVRASVADPRGAPPLAPAEIAFVRAAAPAVLLAPIWLAPLWRSGLGGGFGGGFGGKSGGGLLRGLRDSFAPPGVGALWLGLCALWSAPFVLTISTGLAISGVALAGALVPASMPLWAAALAFILVGARPRGRARLGLALIAAAMALATAPPLLTAGAETIAAAPWFIAASICFAGVAVGFPRTGLRTTHVVALIGAYSALGLLAADLVARLAGAPLLSFSGLSVGRLAFEIGWHGVLAGVVSVLSFAIAMRKLGPGAAAISSLVPGLAALMAWGALGEIPSVWEAAALAVASYGVWLTQRPSA